MPVLGVCGDSYMSATTNGDRLDLKNSEGKHFTEILAKKINYKYYTLARAACSNSVIRLQIDQMIHDKVDFVIIGMTRADRLEYPAKYSNISFDKFSLQGIFNFVYDTHPDRSSQNPKFNQNNMFTETITNVLAGNYGYKDVRDEEQRESIKRYFMDIYDHGYREKQDSWIISDGIRNLIDAGIPYLALLQDFSIYNQFFKIPNKRHVIRGSDPYLDKLIPFTYPANDGHRRWHTSDKDQVDIANLMCNYIQTNNLLVWS